MNMITPTEPVRETRTIRGSRATINMSRRVIHLPAPMVELEAFTVNGKALTVGTEIKLYSLANILPAAMIRFTDVCMTPLYVACSLETEMTVTGWWSDRARYTTEGWRSVDVLDEPGGIDDAMTVFLVGNADGLTVNGITPRFEAGDLIRIDNEMMHVVAADGETDNLTVLRAQNGTEADAHDEGAAIQTWKLLTPILNDGIKALIRAKSGDDCVPYVVPDDRLQTYYAAAGGNVWLTIVSVLEDRWAAAEAEVTSLADGGQSVNAELLKIKAQLDYWRERAAPGVSFGVI